MWLTEAFPLLEGHHLHGFLKRSHVCCFGSVCSRPEVMEAVAVVLPGLTGEVPSGGSLQTPVRCWNHWCFIGAAVRRSQSVTPANKGTLLVLGGNACRCMCVWVWVCVCARAWACLALLSGSDQIHTYWLSHRVFSHPLMTLLLLSRTQAQKGAQTCKKRGVIRAGRHVKSMNNKWHSWFKHTKRTDDQKSQTNESGAIFISWPLASLCDNHADHITVEGIITSTLLCCCYITDDSPWSWWDWIECHIQTYITDSWCHGLMSFGLFVLVLFPVLYFCCSVLLVIWFCLYLGCVCF